MSTSSAGDCRLHAPEDPDLRIWRYMNFAKFVFLLDSEALFFPYTEHFFDALEGNGQSPAANRAAVSSWHVNEHESEAMWKLYSPLEEAIAVQSRYGRLRAALPDSVQIYEVRYIDAPLEHCSRATALAPFFFKRRAFEHEKELRAVAAERAGRDGSGGAHETDAGWLYPVALDALVEAVYVSPTAPDWLVELTSRVCARYRLRRPVHRSELAGTVRR